MKRIFLWMIFGGILFGCLESGFDTNQLISENVITYLDASQNKDNYPNDPFRIVGVTPHESTWNVIVEYTGGCEAHRFLTYWSGTVSNATPQQAAFWLLHDSNRDSCERIVRDTLQLELDRVFSGQNAEDTTYISIINGFSGRNIQVDPYLVSAIPQGTECTLNTNLVGTICSDGFWQNQWLLLTDTIQGYEKVWIQPVRAADSRIPSSGEYATGISLLFGFKFVEETCADFPDGTIIPAAILCMTKTE